MKRALGLLVVLTWLSLPWLFWQSQQIRPRATTLRSFTGTGHGPVFSDGARLLALLDGKIITLWDVFAGRKLGELAGHTEDARAIAFTPDGSRIATASEDKTVRIWDIATLREIHTLRGHTEQVLAVSFAPDGKMLATAGLDHVVRLWDVEAGKELRILPGSHNEHVLRFSLNGRLLATLQNFMTVHLWNVATGQEKAAFDVDRELGANELAFSREGHPLVLQLKEGAASLVDLDTLQERGRCRIPSLVSIACRTDGRTWAVSCARAGSAAFAKLDYQAVYEFEGALSWLMDLDWGLKWFPPTASTAVLDVATGREIATVPHFAVPALSSDGKTLVTYCADDDRVRLWDVPPRRVVHPLAWSTLALAVLLSGSWWYVRRVCMRTV